MLSFMLLISLATINVNAESLPASKIKINDNISVTVNIPPEYKDVFSEQELKDIALEENLSNNDVINIESV